MRIYRNGLELKVGSVNITIIEDGADGLLFCPSDVYRQIENPDKSYDIWVDFIKSEENMVSLGYLPIFLALYLQTETAYLLRDIAELGLNKPQEYSKEEQWTYVVKSEQSGLYKIGRTMHFYDKGTRSGRLTSLRCADPTIVEVLLIEKDIELEMHHKFEAKRQKGEWFSLSDDDIEYIRKYGKNSLNKKNDPQLTFDFKS